MPFVNSVWSIRILINDPEMCRVGESADERGRADNEVSRKKRDIARPGRPDKSGVGTINRPLRMVL